MKPGRRQYDIPAPGYLKQAVIAQRSIDEPVFARIRHDQIQYTVGPAFYGISDNRITRLIEYDAEKSSYSLRYHRSADMHTIDPVLLHIEQYPHN